MTRIAVIEDGFARDTQVFTADPAIIETDPDWENNFRDMKYSCLYVGIFQGESEDEIRSKAAAAEGVHPNIISLVEMPADTNASTTECEADAGNEYEFKQLLKHVGHDVVVVTYGGDYNVSIECEDCNEVLRSIDNPALGPNATEIQRKQKDKRCIHFWGPDSCKCNNDPGDYGDCIHEGGIAPDSLSLRCPYYRALRHSD